MLFELYDNFSVRLVCGVCCRCPALCVFVQQSEREFAVSVVVVMDVAVALALKLDYSDISV